MSDRIISDGVWGIYVVQGGRRLLDGEATDRSAARRVFAASVWAATPSTRVELVTPAGEVVESAQGAGIDTMK